MIIETIEVGGCRSYILGCIDTHTGAVIPSGIACAVPIGSGAMSARRGTLPVEGSTHCVIAMVTRA